MAHHLQRYRKDAEGGLGSDMSLVSRFVSLFRAESLNSEIRAEHDFHIASLTEELVEAGLEPEEAARQARLQFGNRVRAGEESHDTKGFAWLESTRQDFYYGFRTLVKSPSFAIVAILTLALGIGANTAIFSVVSGVLLNPLPYPDADRIITLFEEIPNFKDGSISYPNFLDWQRMNRTFSAIAAYRPTGFNLSGESEAEQLHGEMISAGFFEILGVESRAGANVSEGGRPPRRGSYGDDLGRAVEAEVRIGAKYHRPAVGSRWRRANGHWSSAFQFSAPN